MYLFTTVPHPHGRCQLQELLGNQFQHMHTVFAYVVSLRRNWTYSILDVQAVLVNKGTASTSEMLTSALRSSHGAVLVGEGTLGKGRSQRTVPLSNGSLLLVSSILYVTADNQPVDKVGLSPDVLCKPEVVEEAYYAGGLLAEGSLLDDPCVNLALTRLTSST